MINSMSNTENQINKLVNKYGSDEPYFRDIEKTFIIAITKDVYAFITDDLKMGKYQ